MKGTFSFILALMVHTLLCAQNQKELTLEDVISGGKNYTQFIPQYKSYSFMGDSELLTLNQGDTLFLADKENSLQTIVSLTELNTLLKENNIKEATSLRGIKWVSNDLIWLQVTNYIVVFNITQKSIEYTIEYPAESQFLSFSAKAKAVSYVLNNDLYLAKVNEESVLIEKADKEGVVLGQSVHRNEFGIDGGIFWSPKGNALAFYRMDESMVTDYPLVNINERVATGENIKYPMAGMKSHEVTIGVFDLNTGSLKYLQTGLPKEKYLTNVAWSTEEDLVLVAELNREQNHMVFNAYDAQKGDLVKTIFEEKSNTWVEPENPAEFLPGSNKKFIWQSERDGFNHIYLYDVENGLIKQVTKGDWVVTKTLGFDKKGAYLFFEATRDGVMNRHLYKVSMSNGKIYKLSHQNGYHSFTLSKSHKLAIDMYSNLSTPREIQLLNLNNQKTNKLFSAPDPFEGYDFGEVKLGTIKAADGHTNLNYRLVLPADFDPDKKYPVVVYVYGGPHAQLVRNSWLGGARYWQLYMAQQGYICFTMDNRGTPDRGCEFEKVIHGELGEHEAADQFEGVKFLKSLPYVDENRMGVHGWSFGGFMTINLMEKYPEIFKVGVSGGPVTDWKYYEIMYGERYMDTPQENPDGYQKANVNLRVENIQGRLLVIHGAIDPTVVWQHSLVFIEQSIKKRKQIDYFVYPRHEHNVLGPDRVHLMEKVTQYFKDFL